MGRRQDEVVLSPFHRSASSRHFGVGALPRIGVDPELPDRIHDGGGVQQYMPHACVRALVNKAVFRGPRSQQEQPPKSGGVLLNSSKQKSGVRSINRGLQGPVRVGIEATGPIHWFERLLAELGHELWIGDSAKIRASEVRKQKTDERDAALILELLLSNRFPRIWVPTPAERDLRQLLWHRHKLVRLRTMLGNQLHFLAMSQGLCRKRKLFTKTGRGELRQLHLDPWASRRRQELLRLLDQIDPAIMELDRAVSEEAKRREGAATRLLRSGGIFTPI
jgi:transposase